MDKLIMDTNAYRYLATGKTLNDIEQLISELKEKERLNNIETLLAPVVTQELLAHVADKTDPSFQKCLVASKAQYLHNIIDGDMSKYSYLVPQETQLTKTYFNSILPSRMDYYNALGQIQYHLAQDTSDIAFSNFQQNLNRIRKDVFDAEANFVTNMHQFVLANDPTATDWHMFKFDSKAKSLFLSDVRSEKSSIAIAMGYLQVIHDRLVSMKLIEPESIEDIKDKALHFVKTFPEPILLYKEVIERFTRHSFDMRVKSRANFIWDIELMFHMGDHRIGGCKLFLITEDDTMIRTALANKRNMSVYNFSDYLEFLGLSHLDQRKGRSN